MFAFYLGSFYTRAHQFCPICVHNGDCLPFFGEKISVLGCNLRSPVLSPMCGYNPSICCCTWSPHGTLIKLPVNGVVEVRSLLQDCQHGKLEARDHSGETKEGIVRKERGVTTCSVHKFLSETLGKQNEDFVNTDVTVQRPLIQRIGLSKTDNNEKGLVEIFSPSQKITKETGLHGGFLPCKRQKQEDEEKEDTGSATATGDMRLEICNLVNVSNAPVSRGQYEGGGHIWEGCWDLIREVQKLNFNWRNMCVLELGCGAGLPGIVAVLLGAHSVTFQDLNHEVVKSGTMPNVVLNLINHWWGGGKATNKQEDISLSWKTLAHSVNLQYYASGFTPTVEYLVKENYLSLHEGEIPTAGDARGMSEVSDVASICESERIHQEVLLATTPESGISGTCENTCQCVFLSGSWIQLYNELTISQWLPPSIRKSTDNKPTPPTNKAFDLILSSETLYREESYETLVNILMSMLSPTGKAIFATKRYYFGLGGGTFRFMDYINKASVTSDKIYEGPGMSIETASRLPFTRDAPAGNSGCDSGTLVASILSTFNDGGKSNIRDVLVIEKKLT